MVEPVRGAMDDGVSGLGKGVVRGVLGVAVKPVVGVFDAVSRTSEGNHQVYLYVFYLFIYLFIVISRCSKCNFTTSRFHSYATSENH